VTHSFEADLLRHVFPLEALLDLGGDDHLGDVVAIHVFLLGWSY
jgi:hypothetical protein